MSLHTEGRVDQLGSWHSQKNLELNDHENCRDGSSQEEPRLNRTPLIRCHSPGEVRIIASSVEQFQPVIFFPRQLRKLNLPWETTVKFYPCIVGSAIGSSIIIRFNAPIANDKGRPQRIVGSAEMLIHRPQPAVPPRPVPLQESGRSRGRMVADLSR